MKKNVITIAMLTVIGFAASAHVDSTTGNIRTPLYSATPTQISGTSAIYKQAVAAAQGEAVGVLSGQIKGEESALFVTGAKAASLLMGVDFKNETEAAMAILEISAQ